MRNIPLFWIGNPEGWASSCVDWTRAKLGTGQKPDVVVLSMTASHPHHPVRRRCHDMNKKINSENQRLLTICRVVQKQKIHTKRPFPPPHITNPETKKSVEISSHLSDKNVCRIPEMKLAIKFSFANLHMLATLLLIIAIYKYSLSLILAQEALQFLFLFLPRVVAGCCHRVVHHAYLTEGFCNACEGAAITCSSFT